MTDSDAATRNDSIYSALSGLGDPAYDKSASISLLPSMKLKTSAIEALYEGVGLARRIIELPVRDSMRAGFEVLVAEPVDGDTTPFTDVLRALKVRKKLLEADRYGELWGGAVVLLVVEDGMSVEEPLDLARVRSLRTLRVLDRHEVSPDYREMDDEGGPMHYRVHPYYGSSKAVGGGRVGIRWHHSRVIRYDGAPLTRRRLLLNSGWHQSRFEAIIRTLLQHLRITSSLAAVTEEAQYNVLKIKGLANMVKADSDGSALTGLKARLRVMNLGKSVTKSAIIDAEGEALESMSRDMTGLEKLYAMSCQELAAVTGMPITKLFGTAPGGLSTDDASGTRSWDDVIDERRRDKHDDPLRRIIECIVASTDSPIAVDAEYSIEWNKLRQLDEKEQAEVGKVTSETDERYWRMGAVEEREIRVSRFGPSTNGGEIVLDPEITAAMELIDNGPPPIPSPSPPTPPPVPPAAGGEA